MAHILATHPVFSAASAGWINCPSLAIFVVIRPEIAWHFLPHALCFVITQRTCYFKAHFGWGFDAPS
ncbi:hypothetical protein BX661DRAFT_2885 [Kickxella alabastrina]|uniref:uncharacterized protein n=1 Tax=Kickxella alabastrina TaxID=61397 RepID=UPI0022209422|nr:uncharacterized protein BX661DRAFT_2885 [Kickxella alabastrina]KAI7834660.1 hypothetical protein BX661DRAFT_2885 [Kickxella alabastrina]